MNKRVGVVIGRMQGLHNDHMAHIIRAVQENDVVMVLIGSSNRRISIKNPFTFEDRCTMIELNLLYRKDWQKVIYRQLPDYPHDDRVWCQTVRHLVRQQAGLGDTVTLYGSNKDESTYYLNIFPDWKQNFTPDVSGFDATHLREAWFKGYQTDRAIRNTPIMKHVSDATVAFMNNMPFNENLQAEWEYYQNEAARFANYPYPDTLNFNCGDAVVTWGDFVLFIERARNPGKGCLALPGGFRNRGERFKDTAERELYEETRINIPPAALAKCVMGSHLFDEGNRSLGIPRATLAVHYDVSGMFLDFPDVYPADDAASHEWVYKKHLDDLATSIYDDHMFIVKHFVG